MGAGQVEENIRKWAWAQIIDASSHVDAGPAVGKAAASCRTPN